MLTVNIPGRGALSLSHLILDYNGTIALDGLVLEGVRPRLEALARENDAARMRLLGLVDVLVDGPYIARERSLDLLYCGSKNQRLIDMNRTREAGEIRLFEPDIW